MALTPDEQKMLDQIQAEKRQEKLQAEGAPIVQAHIDAVAKRPETTEPETSDISPFRVVIGGLRDTMQGVLDFSENLGDTLERATGAPIVRFGDQADNGIVDVVSGQDAADYATKTRQLPGLEEMKGEETAGTAEKIMRGIVSYAVPFVGWSKALGVAKAATFVGRVGRTLAADSMTVLTTQDPKSSNLADIVKNAFGIDDPTLDAFTYDPDDSDIENRLKAVVTNAPVGPAMDGLFRAGGAAIKALRGTRLAPEEALGITEALRKDYGVVRKAASRDAEAATKDIADAVPSTEPFDPARHVSADNHPKSWEEVLTFLHRVSSETNIDNELTTVLHNLAHGDPDNLLARIGIDPAKLDWSEFETPEAVANLQKALMDAQEKVAGQLGRSGQRVPEGALHMAARSLASDADILREVYGKTSNLPEVLMAARMFVGGHAKVLLDLAEKARDVLLEGGDATKEWADFLQAFHRHAFYLGSVRGAGSEVARALRSLQFSARQNLKAGVKEGESIAKKAATPHLDAQAVADEDLNAMQMIDTDAERVMALTTLLDKGGDIGELAQFVRQKNGSFLKRLDGAAKASLGNLFSSTTAGYNLASSFGFLGLRALGKWLAIAPRMMMAPFSTHQAREARIAHMVAWAYTDGIMNAWTPAVANTLSVLEREGAADVFAHADTLGIKTMAKAAAVWHAKAVKAGQGINFERIDLEHSARPLGMNPVDRRKLDGWIEALDMPKLLERGMKWMARAAGETANVAGTLTNAGTALFINAPDQFAGTFAARAGAQAHAVLQAAQEAAKYGIEGKDLTEFLRARVHMITHDVDGWAEKAGEAGSAEAAAAIGEKEAWEAGQQEAREILFQDKMETKVLRAMDKAHQAGGAFASFAVAFVHTPLRILERTAFDYTPIGVFSSRIRQAVLHGTPRQRDQALSQLSLGMLGMYLGYKLAADHDMTFVGNDGGFMSSARVDRESYSLKVGSDTIEISRMDPIGSILGMGADIHAYLQHNEHDINHRHDTLLEKMWHSGAWAITANMASKTWLEGIRNLADLAGAASSGQFVSGLQKWIAQQGRRFVPAAGLQKGVEMTYDPYVREALTFNEQALKYSLLAKTLPVRRDFLGNPVPQNEGERWGLLTWEPEDPDPLLKEMVNLSFNAPRPPKKLAGVDLNSHQYSRWLELRDHVVVNPKVGMTMNDALRALIAMPEYQSLRKEARVAQVRSVMRGYSKLASIQLLQEDKELAKKYLEADTLTQGLQQGLSDDEIDAQTHQLGVELGLSDPRE